MAQRTYDPNRTVDVRTDETAAERKNDAWKMILPFVIGLALGWGIGEMTDRDDVTEPAPSPTYSTPTSPSLTSPELTTPSTPPGDSRLTPGTTTPEGSTTTTPPLENP